jgi:hyperosmotically inducible protein
MSRSRFQPTGANIMNARTRIAAAITTALLFAGGQAIANDEVDDTALTAKVKTALLTDDTAKGTQIDVETKDGIVQLNGFVDSTENKVAAGRVANSVAGVKGVDNNLDVRTTDRSASQVVDDATVTAKVKASLIEDSTTKATEINVDTHGGTVQLNGFVSSQEAKDRAAELAQAIEGVRKVENNLEVRM